MAKKIRNLLAEIDKKYKESEEVSGRKVTGDSGNPDYRGTSVEARECTHSELEGEV
jgi:ribonuclease HI